MARRYEPSDMSLCTLSFHLLISNQRLDVF